MKMLNYPILEEYVLDCKTLMCFRRRQKQEVFLQKGFCVTCASVKSGLQMKHQILD
jgi:hypothetical protein